jgi:hypothetical protein
MPFLRTKLATDWPEDLSPSIGDRILRGILLFVPETNPDYKGKMHLVHEWFIEFDDEGNPWRENGVNADGRPVLAGPDARNYGFWLDTNMKFKDFIDGEVVHKDFFEQLWKETGVQEST